MGRGIFGIDWGSTAFIISKTKSNVSGVYFRLHKRNFRHIYYYHIKELFLKALNDHTFKYDFDSYRDEDVVSQEISLNSSENGLQLYYVANQKNFEKIPGCPIGYWVNKPEIFDNQTISEYGYFSGGRNKTHGNDKYVRYFWEIDHNSTRWAKYSNAGGVRKYFGIEWDVVDWSKEARDFYNSHGGLLNSAYWNKEGITWNLISSQYAAFCIKHSDFIYSSGAPTIFNTEYTCSYYLLGFLNTKIARSYLKLMNPTINTTAGDVLSLPLIETDCASIINVVKECIQFSKQDWDAHETSWDFQRNELLSIDADTYAENIDYKIEKHFEETGEHISLSPAAPKLGSLEWRMEQYKTKWERKFMQLHKNEEELNRQFIDIYGLQDELTPDVPLNEITILQQGEISIE